MISRNIASLGIVRSTVTVLLTYSRIYTNDLDELLANFAALGMPKPRLRFPLPGADVELCAVGSCLIVAGDDEKLAPYRETAATFVVDDIVVAIDGLTDRGAVVVRPVADVPTGRNATVRVGDVQLEFVQWSDEQWARYQSTT